ncbi:MAG: DUF4062 domain-containing protein [Desulforhopalus sp.]|nr:DUF4062 domain-containing protein [Desulforhopalus sp.]
MQIEKRYQVFISSTYLDLELERNEVMQALLELECMPAGMELFPAANDTQWDWIKKVILESDYYIVMVGGRYGTISPATGYSYTEMEYRFALENDIPTIGFIRNKAEEIPHKFCETDTEKTKKLESFKNLVKTKLCKFYDSPSDLGAKVSRSITQLKKQYPAEGWVKGKVLKELPSSEDLFKLKKENDNLKSQIAELEKKIDSKFENYSSGNDTVDIKFNFIRKKLDPSTGGFKKIGDEIKFSRFTWDQIFYFVGGSIFNKERYLQLKFVELIEEKERIKLEAQYSDERIYDFSVSSSVFRKIIFQLKTLELIHVSDQIGPDEYFGLTKKGHKLLEQLAAIPKGDCKIE